MVIHSVIIHQLKKDAGVTGAKVKHSNEVSDVSQEIIQNLVKELNERYKNRNESYGVFDVNNTTTFHTEFSTYHNNMSDANFVSFTKRVTNALREKIDTNAPAKGGYLIFAKYTEYKDFLGVFIVRDTKGMVFRRNTQIKQFDIKQAEHIDFEKMAMACRINLQLFARNEGRYLSFIHKKNDSMSKYFISWIASTDLESDQEDTKYLFKILKDLDTPLDEEGNQQTKEEFMKKVYQHINNIPERRINIRDLSGAFYGDNEKIHKHIQQNSIPINSEFKAHKSVLKRFVEIRAKADNIEISFPLSEYRSSVRINENDANQIIIQSQALSDKVRALISGEE